MTRFASIVAVAISLAYFLGHPAAAPAGKPGRGAGGPPGHAGAPGHAGHHHGFGGGPGIHGGPRYGYGLGYGGLGYRNFGYSSIGYGGYGTVLSVGYGYPYPYAFPTFPNYGCLPYGSYGYPPIVLPAEALFGPAANNRMINANLATQPPLAPPLQLPLAPAAAPQPEKQPQVRVANAAARERAGRFLDFGRERFQNQEYRAAYERFRMAAQSAPDLVEAYVLQAQALVAVENYELAARQLKRALKMHPDWAAAKVNLTQLYGANRIAKAAHLEALAAEAERQPENADLLLLIGAQLYYDGQAKRSLKFFERAAALAGEEELPLPNVPAQAPAPPPAIARPQPMPAENPRPMPPPDVDGQAF